MKTMSLRLAFLAAFFLGAWGLGYYTQIHDIQKILSSHDSHLLWLKTEFSIDEKSYGKILKLYEEYLPLCDSMRTRVLESRRKLKKLISENQEITPSIRKALQEDSILRELCQNTQLEHIYRVRQEMPPRQARRYMEMLFPHLANADNDGETP